MTVISLALVKIAKVAAVVSAAAFSAAAIQVVAGAKAATDPAVKVAMIAAIGSVVVSFFGFLATIIVVFINRRVEKKLELNHADSVLRGEALDAKVVEQGKAIDGRMTDLKDAWQGQTVAKVEAATAQGELKGGTEARAVALDAKTIEDAKSGNFKP